MPVRVGNPDAVFASEPWLAFIDNVQRTSLVGQQDDFVVDDPFTLLLCGNASPLVFTGLVVSGENSRDGSRVLVLNRGTSTVQVTDQDTDSAAGNRCACESESGQILGVGGAMLLVYDGTAERWAVTCLSPGAPIDIAHSAGDFTGSGSMTWTVEVADLVRFTVQQHGRQVVVDVIIADATIGGTPSTSLQVQLPYGWVAEAQFIFAGIAHANDGAARHVTVWVDDNGVLYFQPLSGNWSSVSDGLDMYGRATVEIA
ncbi:MAG: hypothetical protein AB7Q29_13480 [Vicinamibacterales bacterium]